MIGIYYTKVRRCGKCMCGFTSTERVIGEDTLSTPTLFRPRRSVIEGSETRIYRSIKLLRSIKEDDK